MAPHQARPALHHPAVAPGAAPRIFTVGHSILPLARFLALLEENGVRRLADVRRFPGSRRHPQFSSAALAASLAEAGIEYRHVPELGGFRKPRPDSPHVGWKVDTFRGYADHMGTPEFEAALRSLEDWAREADAAVMCAEALPARCHRRLLADALLRDGWRVVHITGPGRREEHALPAFARIEGGRLIYDGRARAQRKGA